MSHINLYDRHDFDEESTDTVLPFTGDPGDEPPGAGTRRDDFGTRKFLDDLTGVGTSDNTTRHEDVTAFGGSYKDHRPVRAAGRSVVRAFDDTSDEGELDDEARHGNVAALDKSSKGREFDDEASDVGHGPVSNGPLLVTLTPWRRFSHGDNDDVLAVYLGTPVVFHGLTFSGSIFRSPSGSVISVFVDVGKANDGLERHMIIRGGYLVLRGVIFKVGDISNTVSSHTTGEMSESDLTAHRRDAERTRSNILGTEFACLVDDVREFLLYVSSTFANDDGAPVLHAKRGSPVKHYILGKDTKYGTRISPAAIPFYSTFSSLLRVFCPDFKESGSTAQGGPDDSVTPRVPKLDAVAGEGIDNLRKIVEGELDKSYPRHKWHLAGAPPHVDLSSFHDHFMLLILEKIRSLIDVAEEMKN